MRSAYEHAERLSPDVSEARNGLTTDVTLLLLRGLTGAFLISQTIDNVVSSERMREFVGFLDQFGFVRPDLLAPLSVWVQFLAGCMLVAGFLTRFAGMAIAVNFIVAVVMVHWNEDFRGWWPAVVLVAIGIDVAARGSGRFGLDRLMFRNRSGHPG